MVLFRYYIFRSLQFTPNDILTIYSIFCSSCTSSLHFLFHFLRYDLLRLSARQALKHPYFREMYKQDGLSEQEDVGQVKKGFAPFKPQRRRKKEKGSDSKTRPEDDVKQQKADQKVSPVKDLEKPKQIANKPSNKTGREKGPPANAPVPGRTSKDNSSKAAKVVTNSQKYTTSSSSQQPQAKVDNGRSRDDRHKGRRSERERDREERRRKRERRERREQRAAEVRFT